MGPKETVADREREFEVHVWDHAADPFQASFDLREDLTEDDLRVLGTAVDVLARDGSDEDLAEVFLATLKVRPDFGPTLLQLVGLTSNKLKVDLDAAAGGRRLRTRVPSDPTRLARNPEVWALAGAYLARRFRTVFGYVADFDKEHVEKAVQALNQATWPGFVRQRRAKLSGHEAEHRLALLFAGMGIDFEPECKAIQPACPDATLNGHSFDLVIPDTRAPRICVMSGVQTANIGQFGESKAQDLKNAHEMLSKEFGDRRPKLIAMIDGIGYRSNRAGLQSILQNADEVVQFSTLWKAGITAADAVGVAVRVALPPGEAAGHEAFLDRYPAVEVVELTDELLAEIGDLGVVEAGEGLLILG
jgi:hypothetical protein